MLNIFTKFYQLFTNKENSFMFLDDTNQGRVINIRQNYDPDETELVMLFIINLIDEINVKIKTVFSPDNFILRINLIAGEENCKHNSIELFYLRLYKYGENNWAYSYNIHHKHEGKESFDDTDHISYLNGIYEYVNKFIQYLETLHTELDLITTIQNKQVSDKHDDYFQYSEIFHLLKSTADEYTIHIEETLLTKIDDIFDSLDI